MLWSNFESVIDKAKIDCKLSGYVLKDHFNATGKLSKRANKAVVMPEDLPTPKKSLKELKKENKLLN